jgi:hypothetical protein
MLHFDLQKSHARGQRRTGEHRGLGPLDHVVRPFSCGVQLRPRISVLFGGLQREGVPNRPRAAVLHYRFFSHNLARNPIVLIHLATTARRRDVEKDVEVGRRAAGLCPLADEPEVSTPGVCLNLNGGSTGGVGIEYEQVGTGGIPRRRRHDVAESAEFRGDQVNAP